MQVFERNPGVAHDVPIWQVARATSAAPTYFKAMTIDGREYIDGGVGANNPSEETYREIMSMNNHRKEAIGLFLSVGTGVDNRINRIATRRYRPGDLKHNRLINLLKFGKKWMTNSEGPHEYMIEKCNEGDFEYYRLDVDEGVGPIKLDAWKKTRRSRKTCPKLNLLYGR